jgi:SPP1 family predicted phage head-tail adaptor
MNIGALDRRITLQKPVTATNDYGEREVTWTGYATVWASIDRKPTASERISGEQVLSFQSVIFNIRYSSIVSILEASHRVSYNSKIYDVLGVQEVGRLEQLRVITESKDNS